MFPRGWPGFGLLLLRVSVAAGCLQGCAQHEAREAWVQLALVALSASLCAGVLTPLTAALAVTLQLTVAVNQCVGSTGFVAITILEATALALLGPGAYSLDALRFGRRVILAESGRDGGGD